jgi:hypothetical protein
MIMYDDTDDSATVPELSSEKTDRAAARRTALLLAIGGSVGLVLGILLTLSVSATYTFFTHTLPTTRDSVQVFNELNQLRQQLNQLNEEKKFQEQEKAEAVRQALSAVTSTVRTPTSGMPSAISSVKKPDGGPFAEVDAEIERLEQTHKVLNTILDMFTPQGNDRAKDREKGRY